MRTLSLCLAICAALALPQAALAAQRWPIGDVVLAAFNKGDLSAALAAQRAELAKCEATRPAADECLGLLLAASNLARMNGDARLGEVYARQALDLAQRTLRAGHPDIATSWNNLAANIQAQGRAAEAEPLYRKALALYEAAFPAGHPDIATSWNNLAYNIQAQGRAAEAEPLYRKALALREAALPAGHPDIATSWNNLAYNIEERGRAAEAEPLYRKALALYEAAFPAGHPIIATSWN
ncbi:MAG: hypothetical protein B7Y97_01975, partial [Sphingomonas sp. 32-66-10]